MDEVSAAGADTTALAALTRRMVRGGDAAFLEFHRTYFARLHRYAFALAGGDAVRAAAADLGRKHSRYARALERFALWWKGADELDAADARLEALLARALAVAGEEHREILRAKYELRLSVREIAGRRGVSEEAVESRLARERRAVREIVNERMRYEDEN